MNDQVPRPATPSVTLDASSPIGIAGPVSPTLSPVDSNAQGSERNATANNPVFRRRRTQLGSLSQAVSNLPNRLPPIRNSNNNIAQDSFLWPCIHSIRYEIASQRDKQAAPEADQNAPGAPHRLSGTIVDGQPSNAAVPKLLQTAQEWRASASDLQQRVLQQVTRRIWPEWRAGRLVDENDGEDGYNPDIMSDSFLHRLWIINIYYALYYYAAMASSLQFKAIWFNFDILFSYVTYVIAGLSALAEVTRIMLGFNGNLNERVPELVGSFLLTFPQILAVAWLSGGQSLVFPLVLPIEISSSILFLILLVTEAIQSYLVIKRMIRYQAAVFVMSLNENDNDSSIKDKAQAVIDKMKQKMKQRSNRVAPLKESEDEDIPLWDL